jgi:CDP-diacylglycerol--glycerol-3-phosphate 3-phosphatidyltransferase
MNIKKEIFYISNLISLSRFLLLAVTVCFLVNQDYLSTIIFIFLIWVSDLLDGYFARSRNEISELGKIIDPLADKVTVIVIIVILSLQDIIPFWYVIIAVARDLVILTGGLYLNSRKNIILQSNMPGKIAVFTIGLTFVISILIAGSQAGQLGNYLIYHTEFLELLYTASVFISLAMIFISLASYFKRFFSILKT